MSPDPWLVFFKKMDASPATQVPVFPRVDAKSIVTSCVFHFQPAQRLSGSTPAGSSPVLKNSSRMEGVQLSKGLFWPGGNNSPTVTPEGKSPVRANSSIWSGVSFFQGSSWTFGLARSIRSRRRRIPRITAPPAAAFHQERSGYTLLGRGSPQTTPSPSRAALPLAHTRGKKRLHKPRPFLRGRRLRAPKPGLRERAIDPATGAQLAGRCCSSLEFARLRARVRSLAGWRGLPRSWLGKGEAMGVSCRRSFCRSFGCTDFGCLRNYAAGCLG